MVVPCFFEVSLACQPQRLGKIVSPTHRDCFVEGADHRREPGMPHDLDPSEGSGMYVPTTRQHLTWCRDTCLLHR